MATQTINGTCHHDCPDSCGWTVTVTVNDGDGDATAASPVAVKLRGNPDHPYSQGELCPKVNRFLDRVYSPDRVLHPLKRVGPKGSGEFEQISWNQALTEIAEQLHSVIDTHGAEAVLPFSDAGNQSLLAMTGLSGRLFGQMGASKLTRAICGVTVGAGMSMTNGTGRGMDALELVHSKLIILWATNTRLTNRHLWPTIEKARADGARLVVIDPIRTMTADAIDEDRGDLFIQPLPGTDIAMMLAMMHVIIRDGLTDEDWIAEHTLGYDELRESVSDWSPESAAKITGIEASVIEQLAIDYATVRPAAIRSLIGAEHHENGAMFFRTLACLPALTGAWAERGGGIAKSVGSYSEDLVDSAFIRLDLEQVEGRPEPRTLNMSRLGDILTSPTAAEGDGPAVHALIVWNCNPLVTVPNAEATRQGLERDDLFTVVHEQFLTDTAQYADIVLPATTQIESDDVVFPWGHLWIGWNSAAIDPVGESCSNTELFRRLATAMGYTEPALFDDDSTLIEQALPSVDLDELRRVGWVRAPYPEDGRPFGDGTFETPSGRVEFVSERLENIGQPRLPTFVAPNEGPGGNSELLAKYPLQLLTPKQHTRFLNSTYSQLPKHGPAEGEPFVELDAEDAAVRELGDGATARVWNDRASVTLPVRISERLRPGVVAIPFGWWRHQHPDGQSANSLTNDTLTEWGGGVAYTDTLVQIEPLLN
ncbi:MAG: molybdopterin-dependent oxidoreductase [Actinobacteria bacterium]|nr:molybdopterin-dependent oxidoreductase [Actinomycetota bacterium]